MSVGAHDPKRSGSIATAKLSRLSLLREGLGSLDSKNPQPAPAERAATFRNVGRTISHTPPRPSSAPGPNGSRVARETATPESGASKSVTIKIRGSVERMTSRLKRPPTFEPMKVGAMPLTKRLPSTVDCGIGPRVPAG